ncbi:MAG: hypothetical protein CK533_14075 [Acidobacterium sp.]|nr:MAG: hypothetical protein CK533_14075 [Acidobacterium sp.]
MQAIVNHYLIQSRLLTLSSRNSIRQIGGVWTSLAWPVAGRRATTLDAQLDTAARRYLASGEGLRLSGSTLSVSSIFKWYGDDFIAAYASRVPGPRPASERGVLGAIAALGPPRRRPPPSPAGPASAVWPTTGH